MEEKAMVREQSPGVMRRFLARQFDVSLCAAIVTAVLTLGFRVDVLQLGWVLSWVVSAAGLLLLLFLEPLFLHLWGTTPGKWAFGDAEISYELVCDGYSWSYAAPITFIFEQEDAKKHEFSLRFDITLRSE